MTYHAAYYQRDIPENWFSKHGLLRPDQLAAVCYLYGAPFFGPGDDIGGREPGRVLSIGCGTGVLEAWLEDNLGLEVVGVDPSPGAQELYAGSTLVSSCPDSLAGFDAVLFVEAIEHIPVFTIDLILGRVQQGTRVIVTNWPDFHPIPPSGWDHITEIDDGFFDRIALGFRVELRRGSHLVMDKL